MNPRLDALHPYPFEKLRALLASASAQPDGLTPINLSIGEPKHAAPERVAQAIRDSLGGLSVYPSTKGDPALRQAIANWLASRYSIPAPDAETQVLPALGSREALFAFTQTVIDPAAGSVVICPNPFYQIYEGATLLAGATPYYVNADALRNFACDWNQVPDEVWKKTRMVFVCSPGNPAGNVMTLDEWEDLFALSDRHGFVIASDECYSEIYFDEAPIGALQAAFRLDRPGYERLVVFSSLSKRSNAPGMRSGFAAGDASLLKSFLLYRTYHGSAMSIAVQKASIAAWNDEAHVHENRRLYAEKFDAVLPILKARRPEGGFYVWLRTPIDDAEFVRRLRHEYNVLVLPGSYLGREVNGRNPGSNHVRIALVAPLAQCVAAAERIAELLRKL
jgi:N-succinyldiaminopimelate aminotransferase